ncbi:MAG: LLM class flavin-dependent oxidoreductase [Candidatus Bathyarchaeia archaeon]
MKLGTSICNPYTRHFAIIAVAILSLDEISNGRAILGIGAGGSLTLFPLKIEMWYKPIKTVKEAVKLIKSLFSGEIVNSDEEFLKAKDIKLFNTQKHRIPVYLGARRPKMLKLIGELADGALLSSLPTQYVEALKHIRSFKSEKKL